MVLVKFDKSNSPPSLTLLPAVVHLGSLEAVELVVPLHLVCFQCEVFIGRFLSDVGLRWLEQGG